MIKPTNSYNRKNSDITGRPLPGKVVKLLLEARWAILAVFALYLAISLLSYTKVDPAWSHATADMRVGNLGGRIGAWIADLVLFMFGSSAALIFVPIVSSMYGGYRQITGKLTAVSTGALHPYEWIFRWFGFLVMLLGSVGLEHLISGERERFLPRAPGGVIGELLAGASLGPLGYAGSIMTFLLMVGLGASLFFGVSWLIIAERLGALIERFVMTSVHRISMVRDRRIGQLAAVRRDELVTQERRRTVEDGFDTLKAPSQMHSRIEPAFEYENASVSASDEPHAVDDRLESLASNDSMSILVSDTQVQPHFPGSIGSTPSVEVDVSEGAVIPDLPDARREGKLLPTEPLRLVVAETEDDRSNVVNVNFRKANDAEAPIQIVAQVVAIPKSERAVREGQGGLFPQILSSALPSIGLLDEVTQISEPVSDEVLAATSRLIERKLKDFGIEVKVVSAFPGPVITRYEIEPSVGVKGSAIVNLARDLARALSLSSLRVVEVIPGKTYMGLELPNAKREIVRLTEIIGSKVYSDGASNLTIALGKDISGDAVVADLAKMPHLLIAGTTGSGKSVGINATILSLLYKADPNDVRMILIDPKMLELSVYEGIPHLLAPVVTDMRQAGHALNWAVGEMERRYKIMSKVGVRNLQGYNDKIAQLKKTGESIPNPFSLTPDDPEPLEKLPNIVIFIDELADLMMVVGKKVEELIARIAQKARAAGIHLILATQRPSVDVITGLIKANIPTRIAFQVSSKIDSRTILDQMGAEALLGMGDMLYMPPGTAHPVRVHGAFVSDDEVHRVVDFLRTQGQPNYIDGILEGGVLLEGSDGGQLGQSSSGDSDEMYEQAVEVVLKNRRASISLVQRHLRIGYNRAARLLEQMENNGIVSTMQTNGNRDILIPASGSAPASQ